MPAELNTLLADIFGLYLKTKNSHWHTSGPYFRDYHLLLDDQADQIFATTDAIAERCLARNIHKPLVTKPSLHRAIIKTINYSSTLASRYRQTNR